MDEYKIYHAPYSMAQIVEAINKYPITNQETGNWMVWDITISSYIDTGVSARGEKGESGGLSIDNPIGTGYFSLNRLSDSSVGTKSVAMGNDCVASGNNSIASGYKCEAEGQNSVAFGSTAKAQGDTVGTAVAIGYSVIAKARQFVCGIFNKEVANTIMRFIVGIGTSSNSRKNGFAVGVDGNGYFAGDIYVQSNCSTANNGSKIIPIPEFTSEDNGKTLQIVNGSLQWV